MTLQDNINASPNRPDCFDFRGFGSKKQLEIMNIEEHLKAASSQIKKKLFNGDFVFKSCTDHTCKIEIDGKYIFELWIANNPKYCFDFYSEVSSDECLFDHLKLTTQKDRLKGWRKVKPLIKEYKEKVLKREKQEEINRLQKELEKLNK